MRKRKRAAVFPPEKTRDAGGKKADDELVVRISPITFLMAVVFVAFGMAYEFACSLTAVVLHECAHAKAAKHYGYALNEIRLMPYGAALCGSAELAHRHEIAIAAAGPALNLALGLIFAAMWWLIPTSYVYTGTFCLCNMYVGLFNLLPIFPLDGGRIALAALSSRIRRKRAYLAMRVISAVFGAACVALFAVSAVYEPNFCFLTVGLFMVVSALIPDNRAKYYELFAFSGRRERMTHPLEVKRYAVTSDAKLSELIKMLDPDRYTVFDVYDDSLKKHSSSARANLPNSSNAKATALLSAEKTLDLIVGLC